MIYGVLKLYFQFLSFLFFAVLENWSVELGFENNVMQPA